MTNSPSDAHWHTTDARGGRRRPEYLGEWGGRQRSWSWLAFYSGHLRHSARQSRQSSVNARCGERSGVNAPRTFWSYWTKFPPPWEERSILREERTWFIWN